MISCLGPTTRCTALLIACLVLPARAVTPDDFAWYWPLGGDTDQALYRVALGADIYRSLNRPDGSDLMITDNREEPVPFARLPASQLTETLHEKVALDFEVLAHAAADDANAPLPALELHHRDGHLVVRTPTRLQPPDAGGRLLFEALIAAPAEPPELPQQRLRFSALSDHRPGLDCRLRDADSAEPAHTRVVLAPSADSRPLRLSAGVDLGANGEAATAWHLACYGQKLPDGFHLESVTLHATGTMAHAEQMTLDPEVAATDQPGVFRFMLDGPFLIEQALVEPSQANVLARIELQSRASSQAPWRKRGEATAATLTGQRRQAEAIRLQADHRDREWRILSEPPLASAPAIELRAEVEELVFLAQGKPPWLLYGGSLQAGPASAEREFLQQAAQRLGPAWQWPQLAPQARQRAAGESVLVAPAEPIAWSLVLLWAVLAAGAVMLGVMAVRLLRPN